MYLPCLFTNGVNIHLMLHDWLPFLRACLFAGVIVFINYDMWVALTEIGRNIAGESGKFDNWPRRFRFSVVIWTYLAEIVAGTVFFVFARLHIFLEKAEDGRRKIWSIELIFIGVMIVFAFFTAGFEELLNLLFG